MVVRSVHFREEISPKPHINVDGVNQFMLCFIPITD